MTTDAVLEQVPIAKIKAAPDNPRRQLGDVSELAESMKIAGVVQPIIVCERDGGYLVVAGARRLAAATMAGFKDVPVIVKEYDEQARVLAMAVENLQREDLSPTEEAGAYQRLLEELKTSQRELSSLVGKTQSHISKRLALLELPKHVQTKVDSGGITIPDALELSKLAEHPERVKAVLAGPNFQRLEVRVRHQLDELAIEKKIAKLEEEMESKGLATTRVRNAWALPKGVCVLKGGTGYTHLALQITAKQHETEPCHAIAIGDDGLGFPVCTNRKNHPKLKTKEEADRATARAQRGSATTPRRSRVRRETPQEKAMAAARDRRLAFVGKLVAKKPPKEALQFLLTYVVESALDYGLDEAMRARALISLGLIDPPEDGSTILPDGIDVVTLIREFAQRGDAELQRASLALAAAQLEDGYGDAENFMRHGATSRTGYPSTRAYLEFLRAAGDELGDLENKRLTEASAVPAKEA